MEERSEARHAAHPEPPEIIEPGIFALLDASPNLILVTDSSARVASMAGRRDAAAYLR